MRGRGSRALHSDLGTTLTLGEENSEGCAGQREAKLFQMNPKEFILVRVLRAVINRRANKVKVIPYLP